MIRSCNARPAAYATKSRNSDSCCLCKRAGIARYRCHRQPDSGAHFGASLAWVALLVSATYSSSLEFLSQIENGSRKMMRLHRSTSSIHQTSTTIPFKQEYWAHLQQVAWHFCTRQATLSPQVQTLNNSIFRANCSIIFLWIVFWYCSLQEPIFALPFFCWL